MLPEFAPPTVEVQTEALGLSAEEVEQLITVPLEQDLLNGVAFLDVIRSESVPGLSKIEIIFEPGTDLLRARQVVNERLTQAHAPAATSRSRRRCCSRSSSTSRVMMVGLSSKSESLIDIGVLARWTIRPRAHGHPRRRQRVGVGPARAAAPGAGRPGAAREPRASRSTRSSAPPGNALWVSPLTFLEASTPGTGGFFDTANQRLGVAAHPADQDAAGPGQGHPSSGDPSAPAASGAAESGSATWPTVVEDHQPLIGDAVFTDGPGVLLVVEKLPDANALEVTVTLDKTLKNLAPGLAGVQVDSSFFRPARYIEKSTDNLRTALLIGLVLLVLALGALLFDLRTAVRQPCSPSARRCRRRSPCSTHAARRLNAMVLAGLVLALVVLIDDAIVSADSIRRRIDRRRRSHRVLAVRGPLAYGTVILLLALLPIFVLNGEAGAFLPPLALSYAVAVVASMLVALTVTPALSVLLLSNARGPPDVAARRVARSRATTGSSPASSAPRAPGSSRSACCSLLGLAVLAPARPGQLVGPRVQGPRPPDPLDGAPGTSLPEMRPHHGAARGRSCGTCRGVDNVGGHAGRAVLGDQAVNVNSSELWVSIDPSADYGKTVAAVEEVVNGYPGIDHSVLTYPQERIDDVLRTPDGVEGKDLTVRMFGHDLDTLRTRRTSCATHDRRSTVSTRPRVELPVQEPTLEVEVDLDRGPGARHQAGDVRRAAATVLSGIEVGQPLRGRRRSSRWSSGARPTLATASTTCDSC